MLRLLGLLGLAAGFAPPLAHRTGVHCATHHAVALCPLLVTMQEEEPAVEANDEVEEVKEEWKPPGLFDPVNLGPWAILLTILSLQALVAFVPRENLPDFLQQLIPLLLGRQYAAPPQLPP